MLIQVEQYGCPSALDSLQSKKPAEDSSLARTSIKASERERTVIALRRRSLVMPASESDTHGCIDAGGQDLQSKGT